MQIFYKTKNILANDTIYKVNVNYSNIFVEFVYFNSYFNLLKILLFSKNLHLFYYKLLQVMQILTNLNFYPELVLNTYYFWTSQILVWNIKKSRRV